jgi:hypothetical protein
VTTSTLKGILIPVDWNEKGEVVAIALSTYDENQYLINEKDSEELKKLIRQEVELSGEIKTKGRKKTIQVKTFSLKKVLDQRSTSGLPTLGTGR